MKSPLLAAASIVAIALSAPAFAGPVEMAKQMDTSAAKYDAPECKEMREALVRPPGVAPPIVVYQHTSGGGAMPPGAAYAIGGIALIMIIGAVAEEARREKIVANIFIERCGEDAFVPYFTAKAEKGDDEAAVHLGNIYAQKQDWPNALRWYQAAADRRNADGELALGSMYAQGNGVAQDRAQAAAWWQKAAGHDSNDANRKLGEMYAQDQNYAKAVEHYVAAASHGDGPSAFALGQMYEQGAGVAPNNFAAFGWYSMATLALYPDAEARRTAVGARLTAEQRDDEIRNVERCYRRHSCRF